MIYFCDSLQDEMFQKFNFDTEWAVRLISKITNDEDIPIEGDAIVKQVLIKLMSKMTISFLLSFYISVFYKNFSLLLSLTIAKC